MRRRFERRNDTCSDRWGGRARGTHHVTLTVSLLTVVLLTGRTLRSFWATARRRELGMAPETHPGKNTLLPVGPQGSVWSRRELLTSSLR